MKTFTNDELKEIIAKHWKWLIGENGGEKADLSSANLSSANLRDANLRYANLRYANLSYANLSDANLSSANLSDANLRYANLSYANLSDANLSSANLSYANLSYTDLSSANLRYANLSYANLRYADLRYADLSETPYANINWLAYIGIVPIKGKARAYKMITKGGTGPQYTGIDYLKAKIVEGDSFDTDVKNHCGHGVNLATLQWVIANKSDSTYRLLLMEFDCTPENVCCPVATDGKFRVRKATKVGECDWNGNLLPATF